jgi:NAD(P)-dependent dehydrogenase (short-subunit alcohol dehydrogenase family)
MAEGSFIVTGGSKGIGQAIARVLVDRGREVVCLSRSGTGPVGRHMACDMTDESAVRATIVRIADQGPIAGLVNNAGVHIGGSAESLSVEDFNRTMALNATAVMVAARETFPFLRQNGGTIVNIGSFFDKIGAPDNLAYCASKAAVAAMTRVMAVEWARYGIGVVNVAPGYIETDLNRNFLAREKVQTWLKSRVPVGHAGKPDDVAHLVAAILTEAIPYLTGETIYIDGAQGINH